MNDRERMLAGQLYCSNDPGLLAQRRRAQGLCRAYNATTGEEPGQRRALLEELLGGMGENCSIEPPFRCDYGSNITVGDHFYANYDLIVLDVCPVRFGSHVMVAPRVSVFAATHPIDAGVRDQMLEYGGPVTVGNHVWIGGHTVIGPNVTIGEGAIIGYGSVVTRDIPAGVIAVGNPCRVLRRITKADQAHWEALAREYYQS